MEESGLLRTKQRLWGSAGMLVGRLRRAFSSPPPPADTSIKYLRGRVDPWDLNPALRPPYDALNTRLDSQTVASAFNQRHFIL